MTGLLKYFLVGFLIVQAMQVTLAEIENVSRGKNTTATTVYLGRGLWIDSANGTASQAVDGNYNNTDLEQCATLLSPSAIRSSPGYVTWEVDLGDLYAIASVTIYNTAVLPEGTFTNYISVCAKYSGRYNPSSCVYIRRYRGSYYSLPPGGHVTVHFSQLVVADSVSIRKSGLLTLCEVDVLGTKVVLSPEENASAGKATSQSGTVRGRSAEYAVDGNTSTTDLSTCSSSIVVDDELINGVPAWWQVNLGDFYLVNTITVYFPTTGRDSLYTRRFRSFISFNDSLPSSYSYSGPGTCHTSNPYVYSSGVTTLNCNRSGGYLLIVGRYVTIWPYTSLFLSSSDSTWASVLTVCEVTVVGVRQNISVDDPAFAVFSPKPETSEDDDSLVFAFSIAAIAVAGFFAILCIIFVIIVIVKLKGRAKSEDGKQPKHKRNAYEDSDPSRRKPKQKRQQRLEMQQPSQPVYADNVDEDTEDYEYIDERHGRQPPPSRNTRY